MGSRAWRDDDEEELRELYTSGKMMDITEIAEYYGKGRRSVISKLVQMKIYINPKELEDKKPSVKAMIREIEDILDIKIETMNLSKKDTLYDILVALKAKVGKE